jgi:hypothetical protein
MAFMPWFLGDTAMSGFMGALDYGLSSIDKPFRAARGVLGGKPREALAAVPFSDSLGLTDPNDNTSGLEIARKWGLARPEDSLADSILGAGVEQAVDPFHLGAGAAAIFGAGRLSKAARSVLGKSSGLVAAMPYVDDAEFLSHMNDTATPIGQFKRLADTAGVKFGLGDDVERVERHAGVIGRGNNELASSYAGFFPLDNEVRINRFRPDIWTGDPNAAEMIEAITGRPDRTNRGWFSTDMPVPLHAGTHEVGHALHHDNIDGRYQYGALSDEKLLDRLLHDRGVYGAGNSIEDQDENAIRWWDEIVSPEVAANLSRYGASQPAEMVAEGWSKLARDRAMGQMTDPDQLDPSFVQQLYAGLGGPSTERHKAFTDQLGRFLRGDKGSMPVGQSGVSPTQFMGAGVGLGGAGIAATDDDPSNDWAVALGLGAAGASLAPGLARPLKGMRPHSFKNPEGPWTPIQY